MRPFALVLLAGCCPNERDQIQVAVEVTNWADVGMDCGGGCGATLDWLLMPENGGAPFDSEEILVSFAAAADAPTLSLAFARDTDKYSFPESYDKAGFSLQIASAAGLSVGLAPVEAHPDAIARPEDPALTGEECNILQVITFDLTMDAAGAAVVGRDTGGAETGG